MNFNSIKEIAAELKPMLDNWLSGQEITSTEVVSCQRIYKFVFFDNSNLFPKNPSNEWDKNSYASMYTCDTCYRNIMNQLNGWYELNK